MKIETTISDDHQAELTVELKPDELEQAKRKAARSIAKKMKIPGFRPGKAPYNVILKQVGEGTVIEEALDLLLDEVYPKILEKADIEPYGPGSLKNVPNLDPPTLEITVPLAPEVDLGDHRAIRIPFEPKEVSEEDVDKAILSMQEQQAIIEPVDRAVEESDMVTVVLMAERKSKDEKLDKTLIEERTVPIVVEKEKTDSADEWPYPGYSRLLIGMSLGDKNTAEYQFAEDYIQENLQGVLAIFHTEIEEIKGRKLPELDDDFAKSVGEYENYQELIDEVKKSLSERFASEQNAEFDNKILDKIIENGAFKYPPQMVKHEIDHQVDDLEKSLKSQGLDMDIYLKGRAIELEELRDDFRPAAEDRIRRGLVLVEAAKQEKIEVTAEDVQERTNKMLDEIRQIFPENEARKLLTKEYIENLTRNIINDEISSRTLEKLRSIAKGELPTKKKSAKGSSEKVKSSTKKKVAKGNSKKAKSSSKKKVTKGSSKKVKSSTKKNDNKISSKRQKSPKKE